MVAASAGLAALLAVSGPVRAGEGQEAARERSVVREADELLRFDSARDLRRRRKALNRLVFGRGGLPERVYPRRTRLLRLEDVARDYPGDLPAREVEELVLTMKTGFRSVMLLYRAESPSRSVVIWHQGHSGTYKPKSDPIGPMLARGHDVLALDMPLLGRNQVEEVQGRKIRNWPRPSHSELESLKRPLAVFMEPIAAAVNHALGNEGYEELTLAGFSGGAWSVTLYAALDPRVRRTIAIAGTMPEDFLHRTGGGREDPPGDMEQRYPPLVELANYLELYLMGAEGEGRREVQIQGLYDLGERVKAPRRSCIRVSEEYQETIVRRLPSLGSGSFELFLDRTVMGHRMSGTILERLLEELPQAEKKAPVGATTGA